MKWRNQREIPTPKTEEWEKNKLTLKVPVPRKRIVSRVTLGLKTLGLKTLGLKMLGLKTLGLKTLGLKTLG